MRALSRDFGAALAGIIVASLCIAGTEAVGHAIGTGAEAPFAIALLGYALGCLAGAALAARLAIRARAAAWSVCVLLAVLAAINLFAFPHPLWFAPLAALIFLGAGLAAPRLALNRQRAA